MNAKQWAVIGSGMLVTCLSVQPAMAGVSIGFGIAAPAPVYVAPAPVYAAPPPVVAAPVMVPTVGIAIGWHGGRYWDGRRWWGRQEWAAHRRW
ncbi:hypothetical protein DM39_6769 [Burkholderia cenocepacia]|uniref:Uncharacterized protein n=1 Tax=Burkholderia cenocepacia TaxID=95486 RepID=A0AAN0VK65_9BURK|nr:hypothetical protein DM39_6769 [Burkholderia cenocepacia]